MSDVKDWKTIGASNADPSPDGFPEAMLRSEVNDSSRIVMSSVKDFYDDITYRRPFESYTYSRTSGVIFEINDGSPETNAFSLLLADQKIHLQYGGNDWYGFITNVGAYTGSLVQITIDWIALESQDVIGPAGIPTLIEVGPKFIKQAAWRSIGTGAEEIPLMSDLDAHVIKTEATLDVGFIGGQTREEIEMAGARGRLNVNGGLDFWQRGTSFTAATSLSNDDGDLCADNFVIISDGNDRVDVNRVTDAPAALPVQHSIEMTSATIPSNNKYGLITFAEFHDALDVGAFDATTKISISFWAKVGSVAGIDALRVGVLNLKNATPSNHPVSLWGSGGVGALSYNITDYELITGGTPEGDVAIPITGTWTEFKIEGLDMNIVASGAGAIALVIHVDESVISTGSKWLISAVQFNIGDKALPFIRQPAATELARCERYCESTFDWEDGIFPSHNQGLAYSLSAITSGTGGTSAAVADWRFSTAKYKIPTLTTYNPADAAPIAGQDWRDPDAVANVAVSSSEVTRRGCHIFMLAGARGVPHYVAAYVHANIWGNN